MLRVLQLLHGVIRQQRSSGHHRAYASISAFILVTMLSVALPACQTKDPTALDQAQVLAILDSVRSLSASIALDITREGPNAWLRYFERSPHFFMASEGKLVFPSNDSADAFVHTFATSVRCIELSWSGLRVDPLTENLAVMSASFHEVITDTSGHQMPQEGYFTAIAEQTAGRWLLRDAHWSLLGRVH